VTLEAHIDDTGSIEVGMGKVSKGEKFYYNSNKMSFRPDCLDAWSSSFKMGDKNTGQKEIKTKDGHEHTFSINVEPCPGKVKKKKDRYIVLFSHHLLVLSHQCRYHIERLLIVQ